MMILLLRQLQMTNSMVRLPTPRTNLIQLYIIRPRSSDFCTPNSTNLRPVDDLAEDAALSFFRQGRHEEVVEVLAEVLLCRKSSTDTECDDFATAIRNELNSLKEPPSWNMGERLPILMGLIAYGYRVAHRRHFLIRRYLT